MLNFQHLIFRSCDLYFHMIMLVVTEFRVNRVPKNDFQYGSRPPYWICCDIIIHHPDSLYYVPSIVLNFHLDWFSTF